MASPPSEVTGEVAAEWPILADLVTAAAPKGRLHAVCFLRGGAERVRHGASAITAYLSAAQMAARKPEAIEYWQSGLRLARALRDVHAATRAQEGLLDFAENELSQSTKLGFAIQALEVAAAEPSCPARIDDLLEAVTQSATHVSVVDRALRIMLGRANPAAKPGIWRRRVEVHRVDALAADHPLVKSAKLHKALKLAQMSGLTELRDEVAADLQECANQDLGMVAFSASSAIFDEEVAKIIDAMVAGDSWEQSLVSFAHFPPVSGEPEKNRELIKQRHAAYPLQALFPTQLLGPDGLPAYTGTSAEDRFEVEVVRWETDLIKGWLPLLVQGLHELPRRHATPSTQDLHGFLQQWPGFAYDLPGVLSVALQRFWAGDADGATYTALPQIERIVRVLVMSQRRGIYRVQEKHTPGQTLGLRALLPILTETHRVPEARIRLYSTSLVHPAGLNLRNLLSHGFAGFAGPEAAALVLHLLLHLGTIESPTAGDQSDPEDSQQAPDSS